MTAHPIVELREGGEVRAAVVLAGDGDRLSVLLADGRDMRLPRARVVHETGDRLEPGPPSRLSASLREWERAAEERASGLDLATLWDLVRSDPSAGALGLADLAVLALGDDSPLARAGVHRAMARPNAWFRYDGKGWHAKSQEEVEQDLERARRARALADERAAFLDAARERLRGADRPLPEGSGKFLRALRDVALRAEASTLRKEAAALVGELEQRADASTPTPDRAFDMLQRLGIFSRDENLALLRAEVRLEFPPDVLAAAAEAAGRPLGDGRTDLRHLDVVTIDDASTAEVDDGLSWEVTPRGVRLGIHISDAAHFVELDSLLDHEALARATSYYLPERSIRMLPPAVSEDAASLVEGLDRPAVSFMVELTPHGEVLGLEIHETVVRVSRRMTYEDCEAALESGEGWLPRLAALAGELEAQRLAAGATPIRAAEVLVEFDELGEPIVRLIDPGRPARQLVSEMMILGNRLVAAWCQDRGIPAIYRKQAPPSGNVPPPPRDRVDPVAVNEFRRSLQRTEVSLEPGPHAGLGVPCYMQVTSPIRRYQDLAMHRMVKASLRGERLPYSREQIQGIAVSTEQAGRQARQVETETDHYWILRALEKRGGEDLRAVVLRTEDRRTFIELLDLGYVTTLAPRPDHARGRALTVRVKSVKPRRGSLTLEQVGA